MKLIIFGATGDLVKAKIMPALNVLNIAPLLYGRKDISDANYIKGELDEITEKLKDTGVTHAYVALPPMYFEQVLKQLAHIPSLQRIALEKPFGTNILEAQRLVEVIVERSLQDRIYLVDHYSGKPALSNLEPLMIENVASISIDAFETNNVDARGAFYDKVGTINDFVQNHIMLIMSTLLKPAHCAKSVSECREEVLAAIEYKSNSLSIGQYEGFRAVVGVSPDSKTETFVSVTFMYKESLPINVRVGKALSEVKTDATITYVDGTKQVITIQSPVNPYEVILKDFVGNTSHYAIGFGEVLRNWTITDSLHEARDAVNPIIYPQGADPDQITC